MRLVALPCNFVADGLEALNVLLVKPNSRHPDINTRIPKRKLADVDTDYTPRTEERTKKVNLLCPHGKELLSCLVFMH